MNRADTKSLSVKENSWVARLAAKKLHAENVAIVIGKTIYLHNVSKQQLLKNEKWLKHELCHIKQFKQYGVITFIAKYLWESLHKGYFNNKYEVEARRAENL
jgi:hypothetical protein